MKTLKMLSILFCLSLTFSAFTQRNDVLLTNSQSLSENRYEDIKGNPFLFKDWQIGIIYPSNEQEPFEEVLLNYNQHTKSFELKKNDRFISLDESWYKKVVVLTKTYEKWIFETNLLPKKKQRFDRLIHQGKGFRIVEVFHTSIVTTEKERYAGTIEVREFDNKSNYFFVQNGKSKLIKLKKKNILALFPTHKSVLEKFAKSNQLKFTKVNDLIKILTDYDQFLVSMEVQKLTHNQQ